MLKATKKEIADITSPERTPERTPEKTPGRTPERTPEKTPAGDPGNGEETAFDKAIKAEMERVRNRISLLQGEIDELEKRLKKLKQFS